MDSWRKIVDSHFSPSWPVSLLWVPPPRGGISSPEIPSCRIHERRLSTNLNEKHNWFRRNEIGGNERSEWVDEWMNEWNKISNQSGKPHMGIQIGLMSKYMNLDLTCFRSSKRFNSVLQHACLQLTLRTMEEWTRMNRLDDSKMKFHNPNSNLRSSKLIIALFHFFKFLICK